MEAKVETTPRCLGSTNKPPPIPPAGLKAILEECRRVYPDQPNPLQVTAVVKYWLGGPDPLDYVSMYSNAGDERRGVPPHWHYVSFGLSDLHGDGRVHESNTTGLSGFGFELTFRLLRESWEVVPPTWPATVLQSLARYVFQSENTFVPGDHISWHLPLDGGGDSRVQHMLMADDARLAPTQTPHGRCSFIQIVGVCREELEAAQQWNGAGVLQLLRRTPVAGGDWLVTDMRRGATIFEAEPSAQEAVDTGVARDGSNLSGVSAKCYWDDIDYPSSGSSSPLSSADARGRHSPPSPRLSRRDEEAIRSALRRGLDEMPSPAATEAAAAAREPVADGYPLELQQTKSLEGVHVKFNHEAGALLPLALRGRLRHGRHFTFKNVLGDIAITLVAEGVEGAFVDAGAPYAAHGPWLQVLVPAEFVEAMLRELDAVPRLDPAELPKMYRWPERHFALTILPEQI